jgi:hypothetical protein
MDDNRLFSLPPGGPSPTDDLLQGAIDLHHHGYPEFTLESRTRLEDAAEIALCRNAGMAGLVLKSHMWPTVGRAYLLRTMVPGIDIIPSITLNTVVGGFNPASVESAAEQGARVMFMPTWSAANDLKRGGFSTYLAKYLDAIAALKPEQGLKVTSESGKVLPEVRECLSLAAKYRMMLCTAHISPRESIALAECARDVGIKEFVFSHPDSRSVGATEDEIKEIMARGGVFEFCVNGFMPSIQRASPRSVIDIVAKYGSERVIITTDYFHEVDPPGSEMIRILLSTLLSAGMEASDLRNMVFRNPRRLLNMPKADGGVVGSGNLSRPE